jgi:2-methylcitrate dehydratase
MTVAAAPGAASLRMAEAAAELTSPAGRDAIVLHLLDTLACALGAERVGGEAVEGIIRLTAAETAPTDGPGATVWATGERASVRAAALRNAVSARYLDINDTYVSRALVHPSDLVAVLVAEAEAGGRSWEELLDAVTVGYEVLCHLADHAEPAAHGFEASSLVPVASALATARLLGLDTGQAAHAVSIACLDAATLRVARSGALSHWKAVSAANAAIKGWSAAKAAAAGLRGPRDALADGDGFFARVTGPLELSADGASRLPRVQLKRYPVQIFIQRPVAIAAALSEQVGEPAGVREVVVTTFGAAVRMVGAPAGPGMSVESADHNLAFAVAAALVNGGLAPGDVHALLDRPDVRRLASVTRVEESAAFTGRYPEDLAAQVQVVLADGRRLAAGTGAGAGAGGGEADPRALVAKFRALTGQDTWAWPWRLAGTPPPADLPDLADSRRTDRQ